MGNLHIHLPQLGAAFSVACFKHGTEDMYTICITEMDKETHLNAALILNNVVLAHLEQLSVKHPEVKCF